MGDEKGAWESAQVGNLGALAKVRRAKRLKTMDEK